MDYSSGPVILDLEGLELTAEEVELLQHPKVGGVIFFARNYESKLQLKSLIKEIRKCAPYLLLCVDQEGGRVQRFKKGFKILPSFAEIAAEYPGNPAKALCFAEQQAFLMADELLKVGIDFSFTPVLDVDRGISAVIGDRSFGNTPEQVTALGLAYIHGMARANMPAVAKHFPGHGAVAADSHQALPVDGRDYTAIAALDLLPFRHAIEHNLYGMMTAHIVFPRVDKNPVTFSKRWLQEILRQELKFGGMVFSDDLNMHGASISDDFAVRAKMALDAGCNLVLICNNRQGAISALDGL